MSAVRKILGVAWRPAVCALLMVWILHAIFLNEGRLSWQREGQSWDALARPEQWHVAWSRGPRELWQTLTLVEPEALLLSILFMGLTILIGVIRWRMVLRVHGLHLSFGRATEISLVAHFFNSFLLGSTGGDLLKAYYAARETHHKKTEAVVTVFVDRLVGLFAMLSFAGLMMLPNLQLLFSHPRLAAVAWFILAMLLGCGLMVGASFWGGVSWTLPRARQWVRRLPKGELLERSLDACREFGRDRGFLFRAMTLSMAANAVCVFQILALAWGLKLAISPVALFVIVPIIICISALPVTPSGLGVRENLYVLMLAVPEINVPATQALSLSLLAYAGSLFWSATGGVVYLTLKRRHQLDEVTEARVVGAN